MKGILKNYHEFSKEDIAYFIKTKTSAVAVDVVASNDEELSKNAGDIFQAFMKLMGNTH